MQALLEWFPDRKAIASGLTIAGFGSGALLATPVFNKLSSMFARLPEYVGRAGEVRLHGCKGNTCAARACGAATC